jgi:dTDP-4-dehydrorhamnose 3,5-epimerase-like enzyme
MRLGDCRLIDLPVVPDARGNLSFVEGENHIPFDIARVFYLYDVPGGESRGGHANRRSDQLIIAMSGSFDVIVDDGFKRMTYGLNRSYFGLYIPRMIWRELANFSSGAVCTVLASARYDAQDYYRSYDEFRQVSRDGQTPAP